MKAQNEQTGIYQVQPVPKDAVRQAEDDTIVQAMRIVARRIRREGPMFTAPQAVKDYLVLQLAQKEYECFGAMFLDSQHQFIGLEVMFKGTLSQTSVYPREIIKRALVVNAGAVVLFHNHPSGQPEPSTADERLTATMKAALAMVDIRTLDHIVVGGTQTVSFAERGLI